MSAVVRISLDQQLMDWMQLRATAQVPLIIAWVEYVCMIVVRSDQLLPVPKCNPYCAAPTAVRTRSAHYCRSRISLWYPGHCALLAVASVRHRSCTRSPGLQGGAQGLRGGGK